MVGPVIVNQGKVVRPSQLIASVSPTNCERIMHIPTIFTLSRCAACASVALVVASMVLYPGGTHLDPIVTGYSFFQNFLSDLGMTVTHGGQSNSLGAGLFVAGFALLALSLAACAIAFMRFHSSSAAARHFARTGALATFLVGVCLVGAAVTPVNVSATWHMRFAMMATVFAPASFVLFAVAAARDGRLPIGVPVGWVILASAVTVWFAMRWGPTVETGTGLTIQTTVQKLVAVVAVCTNIYQTWRAGAVARTLSAELTAG